MEIIEEIKRSLLRVTLYLYHAYEKLIAHLEACKRS